MTAKVSRSKHAKVVLTPSVNLRNIGAVAYSLLGYALQRSKLVAINEKIFFVFTELQSFPMITSKCRDVLIIVVCQGQVVHKE